MSTDNVTPIRPEEPPEPPKQKPEIAFGGFGEGPGCLILWQGLHGVCQQLNRMDGSDTDQYLRMSAAAAVLAELLDDRLMAGADLPD